MTKPSLVIPGRGFIVSIPSGKFKPVTNNQSDIVKKNKLENRTSEVDQNIVRDRKPLTGTVQIASEGEVIPIVFGNQRVSTRMIWWGNYDVDLKTIDFAVRVCANEISDITKIWNMSKAGRLIYDTGLDGKGSLEKYVDGWRIYKGTLDQTADPRIASISGKNENTPAYTGLAYIVFLGYKLDMTQGKIPQFDVFVLGKKPVIDYEVDFEADVISGESPLTVNFTNLSDCAKNYSWDFGDGDGSILANPQHIYDEVGLYTVSLTGSYYIDVTETKMDYIEVLPPDTYFLQHISTGSTRIIDSLIEFNGSIFYTMRILNSNPGYVYKYDLSLQTITYIGNPTLGGYNGKLGIYNNELYFAHNDLGSTFKWNSGTSWTNINMPSTSNRSVQAIFQYGSYLYIAKSNGALSYFQRWNGSVWTDLDPYFPFAILDGIVFNNQIILATGNDIYTFNPSSLTYIKVYDHNCAFAAKTFTIYNNELYIADTCGVLHKSSNGIGWTAYLSIPSSGIILDICFFSGKLHIARQPSGGDQPIIRRELNGSYTNLRPNIANDSFSIARSLLRASNKKLYVGGHYDFWSVGE